MIRIIAGDARGRILKSFRGPGVRPTTGRARESWFGMLGNRVIGARFLDLYAGTGAMGIEALSRGAKRSVLVENNRKGADIIRENLGVLGKLEDSTADVRQMDALAAIAVLERAGEQFDIIFADPPYEDAEAPRKVLEALAAAKHLLAADAEVTLQHPRRLPLPERLGRLHRRIEKVYGDTTLSVYDTIEASNGT